MQVKIKRFEDYQDVTFLNMFMKEVVGYYIIGTITFGLLIVVSVFMIMFREDKRPIHDFIGGTYVSYE